ncbi:hypothetical protein CIL05_06080 [Virgibacillus profundi]|uniref:Lipoprotein n=1 Tax=Virgibacillus profundi TaxID=2024555 RepID=A0A2A2IH28_9BACI|nr:hypothetical protein [Virgibacillus profundi]PAV30668.1 hypothetical protein CIL05_06080 [Virgibacillus profundi]PXY54840.1 hypothetical protein CIT14_06165 [Virgibacillus profundi]
MKKILLSMAILFTTALLLMACSDDANQNGSSDTTDTSEDVPASQSETGDDTEESDQTDQKEDVSESVSDSEIDDSDEIFSKEKESEEGKALSKYTSEEIEYARVWLQLGENQDISELNIERIPAGEPLNPDDKTSANYPEDVIQLAGSRLVDGSVTYSSNGDGTINEYNVPLRWDGKYPAGEDFYKEIIEGTKQVSIAPGDDEKVEELIKILNMD